nr:hypothetical protein [Tanacetum cinerariifolium]
MVLEEEDWVEIFIGGIPDNIQGNAIIVEPTRLQDDVRIANNLMDQNLKGYAVRNAETKRRQGHYKSDCPNLKNHNHGKRTRNKSGIGKARGKAYVLRGEDADPDSNTVTVTMKKTADKSKEMRLKDVLTVWNFSKVFPEDFPGLPPM